MDVSLSVHKEKNPVTHSSCDRLLRDLIKEVIDGSMRGSRRFDVSPILRYGDALKPWASKPTDKQDPTEDHPKAACVLVVARDGRILAVSRKDDPNDYGLPGGKVEDQEDPADAAARELKEETGLVANSLNPVFSALDDDGYLVSTFACEISGQIDTEEQGLIRWVSPATLLNGSFGSYNAQLFNHLGMKTD